MKRIACLLFVATFALTGCSKEITSTEAEDIARDIKEYKVDVDSISELKVKCKVSSHTSGTTNRELSDDKHESSETYELSSRFNYIHIYSSYGSKDKVEESSKSNETERWFYMKKKVLYKVYKNKSLGSETKTYSKVEKYSDAIKEFSNIFDTYMPYAYQLARGDYFLEINSFTNLLGDDYTEGMSYAAKFYSSGAGNLRIAGAAKLDEQKDNGFKRTGVGTLSAKWNHYILKNAVLALTINTTDGTNKNDTKLNIALSEKTSTLVIPSYPNLSNYAESSSILGLY